MEAINLGIDFKYRKSLPNPPFSIEENGCWFWLGTKQRYGKYWDGSKFWSAHVFVYVKLVGDIPNGMELHHGCRNKFCVNPKHMELKSRSEHASMEAKLQNKKRDYHGRFQ